MWKTIIVVVSVVVILALLFPRIRVRVCGLVKAMYVWADGKRVALDTAWGKVTK